MDNLVLKKFGLKLPGFNFVGILAKKLDCKSLFVLLIRIYIMLAVLQGQGDQDTIGLACTQLDLCLANFVVCAEGVLVHHLKEDFLGKDISTRNIKGELARVLRELGVKVSADSLCLLRLLFVTLANPNSHIGVA